MLGPLEFKSIIRGVSIPKYLVDFAYEENIRFTDAIRGVLEDRYKEVHGALPVRPAPTLTPAVAERQMNIERAVLRYPTFSSGGRAKYEALRRWVVSQLGVKYTPIVVGMAIDRMVRAGKLMKFRSRDGRSNSKREYWYVRLAEE